MNTLKYFNEKNNKSLEYIRLYFYKNHIKTVIENTTSDKQRVIFIANRFKSNFNNPISFECNGLIAEYDKSKEEYKVLVIPIELFNSQQLVKEEIEYHYNNNAYKLYKVYDGTIINLYYYNNSWRISTNKAYDATNLIFIDNKTYLDVLNEIIVQYPNFNFNNLDINKCYTMCFKYEKFHPFIENIHFNHNKLIFLQSIDMNKFNTHQKLHINEVEDIGLPISQQYNIESFESI